MKGLNTRELEPSIMKYVPKSKQHMIESCWIDTDGYWITLRDGYNAGRMDVGGCHTIHEDSIKELRYQIAGMEVDRYAEPSEQSYEDTADQEVMTEDEAATIAEYGAEMMMEQPVEVEEEREVSEEEIVQTINDWIYRSLPKYVQKHIDYCDYVEGVYRIHVKTEHGSKEIAERRWVDAGAKVRQFVKNAQ